MTESEALLAGLTQTWISTGSKKQNELAVKLVAELRTKGVEAEVVPIKTRIGTKLSVWRDSEFEKRLKVEKY